MRVPYAGSYGKHWNHQATGYFPGPAELSPLSGKVKSNICCCLYDFMGLHVFLHAGTYVMFLSGKSIGNTLFGRYVGQGVGQGLTQK